MARMMVDGTEFISEKLSGRNREMIKSITLAGAAAAEKRMRENTQQRRHVRTGDMLGSIGNNGYQEWYGGGSTEVYPQESDRKGVRNATKAYVINYGRGGVKRNGGKMGDKFITGDEKNTEEAVYQAMQAESDRLIEEIDKE